MDNYSWISYWEYIDTPIIIDVDFALDIFSKDREKVVELFKIYSKEKNNYQCLDYRKSIGISDKEVVEYLRKLDIGTIRELQRLEKGKRNEVIRKIKDMEGVTIRQLARITGIPKSVIDRI